MNLNQVTIPVNDMDRATEFYRAMGFTQIVDTPHYSRFECPEGDSTFSLSLSDHDFVNGAIIYFENEDLDAWVEKLKAQGIEFEREPEDKDIYGGRPSWKIRQETGSNYTTLVKIAIIHRGVSRSGPDEAFSPTLHGYAVPRGLASALCAQLSYQRKVYPKMELVCLIT